MSTGSGSKTYFASALDSRPGQLGAMMRNVGVTVEHNPGPRGLVARCRGSPAHQPDVQLRRGAARAHHHLLPGYCAICWTGAEVAEQAARPSCTRSGTTSVSAMKGLGELGW